MPSYVTPKNGTAFILYIGLRSQADSTKFQVNPTLATNDVKVSIDGGALANLATLPVVTPAGGKGVKVALSGAEMTGDNITVVFSDVAGAEWFDEIINIQTTARQIDDLSIEPAGFKKNTALLAFTFPIFDPSDHLTPKTGLTVTATRSLDGAAFGACANAVAEIGVTGYYKLDLAAGDLNGDIVVFKFAATGGDVQTFTVKTVP